MSNTQLPKVSAYGHMKGFNTASTKAHAWRYLNRFLQKKGYKIVNLPPEDALRDLMKEVAPEIPLSKMETISSIFLRGVCGKWTMIEALYLGRLIDFMEERKQGQHNGIKPPITGNDMAVLKDEAIGFSWAVFKQNVSVYMQDRLNEEVRKSVEKKPVKPKKEISFYVQKVKAK